MLTIRSIQAIPALFRHYFVESTSLAVTARFSVGKVFSAMKDIYNDDPVLVTKRINPRILWQKKNHHEEHEEHEVGIGLGSEFRNCHQIPVYLRPFLEFQTH